MTKETRDLYNKEINQFWKEPFLSEDNSRSWDLLMMTYERLCEKLPFIPFTIIKDKVYLDGEIQSSFKEAIFIAIGECCKRYNNREYLIRYD